MDALKGNATTPEFVAVIDPDLDTVSEHNACPRCYEDRVDRLVWQEDGETVKCATCGMVYRP